MWKRKTLLLILLFTFSICTGCGTDTPIIQHGSVSGRIMLPFDFKNNDISSIRDVGGWNYPLTNATVSIKDKNAKEYITFTNENGNYIFSNVVPGKNYIITAVSTQKGDAIILKDVAVEVNPGNNYDAGTADAESTATALVLEKISEETEINIEEIDISKITQDENFDDLVISADEAINQGTNILTSPLVLDSLNNIDPNTYTADPSGNYAGIVGKLTNGATKLGGQMDGYIFVLSEDGQILQHTHTINQKGDFQLSFLPFGEKVTLVGFNPEYKFNMARKDIILDEKVKNIGYFTSYMVMDANYIKGEFAGPNVTPVGSFAGIVCVVTTIYQNIQAAEYRNQSYELGKFLLEEIGYYDDFDVEVLKSENKEQIIYMLYKFDIALANENWSEAKMYCVPNSQAVEYINEYSSAIDDLSNMCDEYSFQVSGDYGIEDFSIVITGTAYSSATATGPLVHFTITCIMGNEDLSVSGDSSSIYYFKKIGGNWLISEIGGDAYNFN